PAGLILAQLLHQQGIASVILEHRSRAYVEGRIRAGVLEQVTVDLLRRAQVNERMDKEGMPHHGFSLAFNGRLYRIDIHSLTGGRQVMIYGQTEVTKDLNDKREEMGLMTFYEARAVAEEDFYSPKPRIVYEHEGQTKELVCDFVAGCDGYHGISRQMVQNKMTQFEKIYPFGWLGILSDTPPVDEELIYANHERGFALCSMRS